MQERSIFLKVLELKTPEARAAFLDEQCAQDEVLRRRIEALLKANEQSGGVVDALLGADEPTSSMHSLKGGAPPERAVDSDDWNFLGPSTTPGCLGSLGPYEVIEVIGRGGMGLVFKARDTKLQRIVAIKVLAPEIAANKTAKRRFEREAQAAAAVSHDHIVTIHAVDEFHSLPYLVMECIVGRSLQQKIEETGPLELKEILRIGMQAALGLAAAHKQGLVHRDIKPANILLQNGIQRVKITDFGLARATDDVGMTHTGQIAGTPLYMSPEQAQGQKVDHTSDLFSLGSVLYTMATGRPAFRAPSTIAVLRRVVDDTPRPVNEINEEFPSWLSDIISKLMAKKKEDRFQTASEVAELLSRRLARLQEPQSSTSNKSVVASPEKAKSELLKPKSEPGRKSAVTSKVASSSRVSAASRGEDELLELPERSRRVKPVRKETRWDRMRKASPLTWLVAGVLVPGMIALIVMMGLLLNRDQLLVRIELDETLRQQDVTLVIDGTTYAARDLGPSIRVKPGPHTLEVKRGNERFTSEQFTIFQNDKPLFRVKTEGGRLSVERADPGKEVQILAGVLSTSPMQRSWHGWPADAPLPAIAPFTAEQAKKHQQEWATYLKVPVEWRNSIDMKFILIPPGEFTMGSTGEEIDAAVKAVDSNDRHWQECIKSESPQHKVILTQPIYLGVNEVTQAEYEKVMGVNPSHFAPMGTGKEAVAGLETGNHPSEQVSWDDAAEFCAKLSQREKLRPFYFRAGKTVTPLEGMGYRLPSEAQWEFACRAGTTTKYWIGDKDDDLVKTDWLAVNSGGRTHSTGEFRANPFGLVDIHGNVCEWVEDGWDAAYYGQFKEVPAVDSRNPFSGCDLRVVRGGGWVITSSLLCRSSHRYAFSPPHSTLYFGFRVSLPVDAIKYVISQNSRTEPQPAPSPPLAFRTPEFAVWAERVASLPFLKHAEEVRKKLIELNPNFSAEFIPHYENQELTGVTLIADDIIDISPVRAIPKLKVLHCSGNMGRSGFRDLTPLQGLPLIELRIEGNPIDDLSPIKDLKLKNLRCGYTKVSDLSPLKDMKLEALGCWHTAVSDLSPLNPERLKELELNRLPITSLDMIKHFKLTSLNITATAISDLTPIKDMPLEGFDCALTPVTDLSPLNGIKLRYLNCGGTRINSLQALKDSELTSLNCQDTQVSDLAPIQGKKITSLYCGNSLISDLSPLKGMPLIELHCQGAKVTDHSPLQGMTLRTLSLDFDAKRDTQILRSIKTLQVVNGKPVEQFWKDVESQTIQTSRTTGSTSTPEYKRFVEWMTSRGGSVTPAFPPNGELPHQVHVHIDSMFKKVINDADLENFKDLPGVHEINIRAQSITSKGMVRLGQLMRNKPLSSIHLLDMHLGLDWLREPGGLSEVTWAKFQNVDATNDQLAYLANLPKLETIGLRHNPKITDAGIEHLRKFTNLKSIDLTSCGLTESGIAKLRSLLPGCQILPVPPVPAGVTGTPEFRAFVEWVKSRGGSVDPEVPTNGELPHMVELHIDPAKRRPISDEEIDRFRDLPGLLNGINMRSQAVTTDGLIHLGEVMADKPIGQIFLVDMPVGLDWLREPGGFSIIHGATFQNINAKDDQLKNLKKLSRLSYINLRYNKDITDKSIDYFIEHKSLETLHLDDSGISPAGLARLRAARPELKVTPLPPDNAQAR